MTQEALKLALEALVLNNDEWKSLADSGDSGYWKAEDQDHYKQTNEAITAIKEALAQPEQQKPYRLLQDNGSKYFGESWDKAEQPEQEPVAFAGIEMWVGNTKIKLCLTQMQLHNAKEPWMLIEHMAEMCISKLKEKNT